MSLIVLLDDTIRALRRRADNAARRNKPTMWAYYEQMIRTLRLIGTEDQVRQWLTHLSERAIHECPRIGDPTEAARLWAAGVYARRILRAAGHPVPKASLAWLRERLSA